MSIKHKIRNLVAPLYNKVWHGPKGKIRERLKKACDDLPKNQRLMVVTVLLSVFVLTAFFVFGHACYRMGAGHARQAIEVEHIKQLEIPSENNPDVSLNNILHEAAR
ncbi:MAG: TraL conjugative transposon family protein [Muribaculaceae bacterium]|nr:TraL conjugative transposon family protein [Muribaculaceae bacterium]